MEEAEDFHASNWTYEEVEAYLRHLSEESFKNRLPLVLYLALISFIGFMGNSFVLLVYWLRFKPCASRVFVMAMASCDFIANTVGIPLQIVTIRYAYDIDDYWLCRGFFAFATISTQASGFLLVLVALDRFNRICRPFKTQLNSRKSSFLSVFVVILAVVSFGSFTPFYGIHRVNTTEPGIQARMCWAEDEFRDTVYPIAFTYTVTVTFFLGLITMATSYILIGVKLFRKKVRKINSYRSNNHQQASHVATADKTAKPNGNNTSDNAARYKRKDDLNHEATMLEKRPHPDIEASSSYSGSEEDISSAYFENRSGRDMPASCPTDRDRSQARQLHDAGTLRQPQAESASDVPEPRAADVKSGRGPRLPSLQGSLRTKWRKFSASSRTRRMRSRTTLMMSVLTLLYVVNWLPHMVMKHVRSDAVNMCDNFTDCGHNLHAIMMRSFYLNSAVNAFVYGFCNARFRQECREFLAILFGKEI